MNKIIAIRYIDTECFDKEVSKDTALKVHYSVGKLLFSAKDFIIILFTEKNSVPWRGLLVPNESIIFEENNYKKKQLDIKNNNSITGGAVGIFWKDVVYFENGIIPQSYSTMYTEGSIFSVTPDTLIIKNAETIHIKPNKTQMHHLQKKDKKFFCVIPRRLITNIEKYEL